MDDQRTIWIKEEESNEIPSSPGSMLLQDPLKIKEPCFDIKEDPELNLNERPYEQSLCQDPLKIEEPGFGIKEDPGLELNVGPSEHSVCKDALKIEESCFRIKEDPGLESNVDPSERSGGDVRWCLQRGLIAKKRNCDKCSRPMKLTKNKGLNDGVRWFCSQDMSHCSIRRKSWFAGSRLPIGDILKITYLWVQKCSNAFITEELNLSTLTVVKWRSFCREVCVKDCITNGDVLGGVGSVVEIIEAKLAKQKYVKGKPITDGWVFGGIERGSNKCFFEVVPKTTKHVFLNVLKKYVLPETTVISECFRSYDCLSDNDLSVKHKLNCIDSVTGNRNPIEGSWPWIKRNFRQTKKCKDVLDSHLFEYMWRRKWSDANDLFITFLEAICRVYNPE